MPDPYEPRPEEGFDRPLPINPGMFIPNADVEPDPYAPRLADRAAEPREIDASMLATEVDFEKGINVYPLVTIVLILVCAAAFIGEVGKGVLGEPRNVQQAEEQVKRLIAVGALDPVPVRQGEVWRLVSAMFLHGSVDHLIGNVIALYILGMACEHGYGRLQFVTLYVFAGIIGSLVSLGAGHTSVGASGAIFGLAGGIVMLFLKHRHKLELRDKRIGFVLAFWAAYQIFLGAFNPGVDNWAHVGGFLGGALLGWMLLPAVLLDRAEVNAQPRTLAGFFLALGCLLITAIFFIPRLVG